MRTSIQSGRSDARVNIDRDPRECPRECAGDRGYLAANQPDRPVVRDSARRQCRTNAPLRPATKRQYSRGVRGNIHNLRGGGDRDGVGCGNYSIVGCGGCGAANPRRAVGPVASAGACDGSHVSGPLCEAASGRTETLAHTRVIANNVLPHDAPDAKRDSLARPERRPEAREPYDDPPPPINPLDRKSVVE